MKKKVILLFFLCFLLSVFVFPTQIYSKERTKERRCGQLGPISIIGDAALVEDCAEWALRPFTFGPKRYDWWICRLAWVPVIGSRIETVCRLRIDSEGVSSRLIPKKAQPTPLPPPENLATQAAGLGGEEIKTQGILDLISWLLKIIAGFTVKKESGGHIAAALPSQLKATRKNLAKIRTMEEPGERETEEDIVLGFDTLKRAYTPYALQEKPKPPGVPLPPELEPSPSPSPPGAPTPTPLPPRAPLPTPPPAGGLWYRIDHRNPLIVVSDKKKEEIISLVLKYWPRSLIDDAWGDVEQRAIENGWNPSFVIALWIEESGASGVHAWDVGCTGAPKNNLEAGLSCLFGLPYGDRDFPEFMCIFSEGHYPCTFSINPNFPKNLKIWYDRLVPAGTDGAAQPL